MPRISPSSSSSSTSFRLILLLCCLLSTFVGSALGAWQQIADYTDCGSSNFKTEKILVNLDDQTYWLNVSIVGNFTTQVVDADVSTNRASKSLLMLFANALYSHAHHFSILSLESDLFR